MEQIIEVRAIINFAKAYRVAEGGTTNEGITVNYLMTDSLKPYEDLTNGSQGYKSTKASVPLEVADKLVAVPGYYKLACTLGVNSQNQAQLKPFDVEFLSYCDLKFSDTIEGLAEPAKVEPETVEPAEPVKTESKAKADSKGAKK